MHKLRSIYKFLLVLNIIILFSIAVHANSFQLIFYFNDLNEKSTIHTSEFNDSIYTNIGDSLHNIIFTNNSFSDEFNSKYISKFLILNTKFLQNNISPKFLDNCNLMIASNLKTINDTAALKTTRKRIISLDDTTKIGFMGLVKPDFPLLYPKISTNISIRLDIFDLTREIVDQFIKENVDIIILINFMDEYLNFQLLKRFPEIDYIFDTNLEGKNDYSRIESLKNKLHYINTEKQDLRIYRINYSREKDSKIELIKIIDYQ